MTYYVIIALLYFVKNVQNNVKRYNI